MLPLFGLLFGPEDGGFVFLRNVDSSLSGACVCHASADQSYDLWHKDSVHTVLEIHLATLW
jgi:hypothetical protein